MSTKETREQLKNYYRENHTLPSIREFCGLLGKSDNYRTQAKRILDSLSEENFLTQNEKGKYLPGENFFAYELYHGVKAGGFTHINDLMDYINLEQYLVRKPNDTIIITVNGDSMIEAGLDDGDLVIVERGSKCRDGDIVVAQLDGNYTVKYYKTDKSGTPYLEPANPNYKPIQFENDNKVELIGIVTKAIKNF